MEDDQGSRCGTECCVSVVVPIYNEATTVGEVIGRLLELSIVSQVIAVDDGSTEAIELDYSADHRVLALRHRANRGKGAAIRTALEHVTGDVVVIQDADFEYAPEEIPTLVDPILNGEADVSYGTRFGSGRVNHTPLVRRLANRMLTWASNLATGLSLTDMETGHKAFRREVLEGLTIQEDRFGFEPEITAKIAKRRARVSEVAVSYCPRSYTEGKKIGIRDGLRAILCIAWYKFHG